MHIRKIDLYVFKEVFFPFFAGIFFFSFIFILFQMFRLAEELIVNNAPMGMVMKLLWTLVLNFLPLGLPVAFLVGVLIAFSRMSGDSEIVAMKAGGIGLPRLSVPVFVIAAGVAAFSLLLNLSWAPWAEVAMRNTMIKIGNRKFASSINEGTFSSGFFNLLLYTEKANNRAGKMEKVFIYDERDPANPMTVISKTGELIRVQSSEEDLGGLVLQLQDGSIHQSEPKASDYNKVDFGTYQIFFDIPDKTGQFAHRPRMYEMRELIEKIRDPKNTPARDRELRTDFWRRLAVAMTPLLFVIFGMGFGTVRTRGARAGVILIAFVTMALYWQVQVTSLWIGEEGHLPPWLAVQIPNFLVGGVGLFMFRRACW
ncbi:LPS export ABC transporter permease LptF [bacterium]|jgi:lipopolysaccharide export system permease protein|nr:LPS export ABC transporter permease LptF [bacterium]